jgi:16S rRNA (uracil1498-N3)-methyltransferase
MMPRLYIPNPLDKNHLVELDEGQHRYLTRTLRLGVGAKLTLFSPEGEQGQWQGELVQTQKPAQVRLISFEPLQKESPVKITLVQGLAKGQSTELVIQKAVELGATTIIPLVSERSVRRSKADRNDNKLKRWQTIILEAAQQCGRVRLPQIYSPVEWEELATILPEGPRYLFWEEQGLSGARLSKLPHPGQSVTLLVGPEGGLTSQEVQMAQEKWGFIIVGLGPRILRTETAGLAVLSACQVLWGDMG